MPGQCWQPLQADITFPRAESDRLIFVASLSLSPWAPVLVCLSLPAKSTKLSFPTLIWFSPSTPNSLHSTVITKMTDLWRANMMPSLGTADSETVKCG
uniref:Uncharacterized protein n=1 Tax=Sphaeramia orbicularis TaxID=375764 RepID=A0A673BLH9_9TELE